MLVDGMEWHEALLIATALVGVAVVLFAWLFVSAARRLGERRRLALTEAKRAREISLVNEAVAQLHAGTLGTRWVPVNLMRGEECYHAAPASYELVFRSGWAERDAAAPRAAGDAGSYPQLPSRSILPVSEAYQGSVYVTNERIVFVADDKSVSLGWNRVRDVVPYADGFRLDAGSDRFVVFRTGDARAAALVRALLDRTAAKSAQVAAAV